MYGADRQLLESVRALVQDGHEVWVYLPVTGPLGAALAHAGAKVCLVPFPVLRKASMSVRGLATLAWEATAAVTKIWRVTRQSGVRAVYVNTVTIPWWLIGARLSGRPILCHVHEAEHVGSRPVAWALSAPLFLASVVVTNSQASSDVVTQTFPKLAGRLRVLYNGVPVPRRTHSRLAPSGTGPRLALIGRLSPRKGTDVALEAVKLLRSRGRDVVLDVCGSTFTGYEWFEEKLRRRADDPELAGSVVWHGFIGDTWPVLDLASVVLVPSRQEPFGNTAVEGQLAGRPVVASRVQGLCEIIQDGVTGLLVDPGDPAGLADAVERLLDDPAMAQRLAAAGCERASDRFSLAAYHRRVCDVVATLSARPGPFYKRGSCLATTGRHKRHPREQKRTAPVKGWRRPLLRD